MPVQLAEPTPPIQTLDPKLYLRMNLQMEVNGFKIQGMGVAPRNLGGAYVIKGKAPSDLALLTISSCGREDPIEKSDKEFVYTYSPNGKAEASGCALYIEGLDKSKGRHTLGFVMFEDTLNYSLQAKVYCGKAMVQAKGVALCQARETLVSEIQFDRPVEVEPEGECPAPEKLEGNLYRIATRKGWCSYVFSTIAGVPELLQLTTYGYEVIGLEKD